MCLSSLPGLARVRHWSCPERLPSLSTEELLLPVRAKDAETMVRTPGLALWEEKVLSLRENRSNKHRNLLLGRKEKVVDGVVKEVKEEPIRCTERVEEEAEEKICAGEEVERSVSMQERLLRAFLTEDQERGNPAEKCVPTCDNLLHIQEEASLSDHCTEIYLELADEDDEALSSARESNLHISVGSPLQGQLPPDPGPSEGPSCLQPSDQLRDEPELSLTATRPDPKPPSEQDDMASRFSSDQHLDLCPPPALLPGHLSSYSYISALAPCLLFILSIFSSSPQSQRQQRRLHGLHKSVSISKPRRPPWLLLAASCFLLQTAPVLAIETLEMLAESPPEGPICTDGVFRGNIDINNRDEESKMSILAKYVNCSVVEGSISITSALYSDQDTNYSMPNLTEVLLPAATSSPQKIPHSPGQMYSYLVVLILFLR